MMMAALLGEVTPETKAVPARHFIMEGYALRVQLLARCIGTAPFRGLVAAGQAAWPCGPGDYGRIVLRINAPKMSMGEFHRNRKRPSSPRGKNFLGSHQRHARRTGGYPTNKEARPACALWLARREAAAGRGLSGGAFCSLNL